jgi:hypothetical protein
MSATLWESPGLARYFPLILGHIKRSNSLENGKYRACRAFPRICSAASARVTRGCRLKTSRASGSDWKSVVSLVGIGYGSSHPRRGRCVQASQGSHRSRTMD